MHQAELPKAYCFWSAASQGSVLAQVDKARSWLLRAVQLARGDNGDFWALLYKLESQYGTADSQRKVLEEMRKAEPHHGERWQRVSKDPANAHASLETILKKVVVDIDKEAAP